MGEVGNRRRRAAASLPGPGRQGRRHTGAAAAGARHLRGDGQAGRARAVRRRRHRPGRLRGGAASGDHVGAAAPGRSRGRVAVRGHPARAARAGHLPRLAGDQRGHGRQPAPAPAGRGGPSRACLGARFLWRAPGPGQGRQPAGRDPRPDSGRRGADPAPSGSAAAGRRADRGRLVGRRADRGRRAGHAGLPVYRGRAVASGGRRRPEPVPRAGLVAAARSWASAAALTP